MPTSSASKGLSAVVSVSRAIGAAGSMAASRRCTRAARAGAVVISCGVRAGGSGFPSGQAFAAEAFAAEAIAAEAAAGSNAGSTAGPMAGSAARSPDCCCAAVAVESPLAPPLWLLLAPFSASLPAPLQLVPAALLPAASADKSWAKF